MFSKLNDWMKNNPAISHPAIALFFALISFFTAKYGINIPVPPPSTDNYYVMPAPLDVVGAGVTAKPAEFVADGKRFFHPFFRGMLNVKAAREYRKEHPELSMQEAINIVAIVPDTAIAEEATKQKMDLKGVPIFGQIGDGKILQWFIDHQDQIMAIIKIIMMLAPLFADHQPTFDMLAIPPPDVRVGQVPYPLAWWKPDYSLSV